MRTKILSKISCISTMLIILSSLTFAQKTNAKQEKNKFLENKKYSVQFYEIKPTGRGKAMPAIVEIKGGRIGSDLMEERIKLSDCNFNINLDSTYTEDESEVRLINIVASHTEDKNDFKWEATITNYDIEGTVLQQKGGIDKKKFEFSGSEKTKKK